MRKAQESCYRFTSAMAGDQPGFEEASRSSFAGDHGRFDRQSEFWSVDVRDYARQLAAAAFK